MRKVILCLAFVTACALWSLSASADVLLYDVTGHIDSNDFLLLQGSTFQWHHIDTGGAAVGRHSGNNFPTVISSTLNGVTQMPITNWTPTWPQPVPNEIRFDAFSSVLNGVSPELPAFAPLAVDTSVVSGRGLLTVTQLPTASNSYQLIVRFSDGFNGSADLRGTITVTTPEPGMMGAGAAVVMLCGLGRRCRLLRV